MDQDQPRPPGSPDGADAAPAMIPCPICGEPITETVKKCRHCGEWVSRTCEDCNTPLRGEFASRGVCADCATRRASAVQRPPEVTPLFIGGKSKGVAALLAFFLGGLGIHKFYLGRIGMGILYVLFSWTLIPTLVGMVEALVYLLADEREFQRKYGRVI